MLILSEKNIDMAEIMYYGKKGVEMRRSFLSYLSESGFTEKSA